LQFQNIYGNIELYKAEQNPKSYIELIKK